jgi:acylphosphatase
MEKLVRALVLVEGRVQGVFFRAHTRDEAQALGLKGWVRNLPDGRVQALVEGPQKHVDALIAWCRIGPRYAYVDDVQIEWQPFQGDLTDFRIV